MVVLSQLFSQGLEIRRAHGKSEGKKPRDCGETNKYVLLAAKMISMLIKFLLKNLGRVIPEIVWIGDALLIIVWLKLCSFPRHASIKKILGLPTKVCIT